MWVAWPGEPSGSGAQWVGALAPFLRGLGSHRSSQAHRPVTARTRSVQAGGASERMGLVVVGPGRLPGRPAVAHVRRAARMGQPGLFSEEVWHMAEQEQRRRDATIEEGATTGQHGARPHLRSHAQRHRDAGDQTPSPLPLEPIQREGRAFELFCRGHSHAEIAHQLGVSRPTAARFIRGQLRRLDVDLGANQRLRLTRAIAAQQAIARAAWARLEREAALEEAWLRGELDRVRRRTLHRTASGAPALRDQSALLAEEAAEAVGGAVIAEEYITPRIYFHQAHLLSVVLAAEREIARLQDLYDMTDITGSDVHVFVSRQRDDAEQLWITTENGPPPAPHAASGHSTP